MKTLANMLGLPDYKLHRVIEELEALSGHQSEDVKLLAHNQSLLRTKITSLGLDPNDTTDKELLLSLANKLKRDMDQVHRALNIAQSDSADAVARKVITVALHCSAGEEVLAIKVAAAKKLLRATPPKRLMKLLGYRSLESMLKREDARKLFAFLPAAESATWNQAFAKSLKNLNRSNYEMRPVEFLNLNIKGLDDKTRVGYVPLMAAVTLIPHKDINVRALEVVYQMLQAEEILQADTFYLQSHQLSRGFSDHARLVFNSAEPPPIKIAGQDFIKWHQLKDLSSKASSPLERLAKIHPLLNWWREAGQLAHRHGSLVSLHLGDVFKSLHDKNMPQVTFNLQQELRQALIRRYAAYPGVKNYFNLQLDDKVIALEPVSDEEEISRQLQSEFI